MEFLTAPLGVAGPLTWAALVAQAVVLSVGVYLGFLRRIGPTLQRQATQRLGYALIVFGALGVLAAALRIALVAPFNTRVYFAVVVLFELAALVFASYYFRSVLPQQLAAQQSSQRLVRRATTPRPSQTAAITSGSSDGTSATTNTPREVSSRRDSRRAHKRRGGKR